MLVYFQLEVDYYPNEANKNSLRTNQIYVKIDEVKIKPYLHQNHFICSISLFVNCFHLEEQLDPSQCHILYLDLFRLSNNGIYNSVFQVFMKTQLPIFKNAP